MLQYRKAKVLTPIDHYTDARTFPKNILGDIIKNRFRSWKRTNQLDCELNRFLILRIDLWTLFLIRYPIFSIYHINIYIKHLTNIWRYPIAYDNAFGYVRYIFQKISTNIFIYRIRLIVIYIFIYSLLNNFSTFRGPGGKLLRIRTPHRSWTENMQNRIGHLIQASRESPPEL